MTAADVVIARVIRREGGIKDVGDGKGLTRFGQTPGWLAQFGLPAPDTPAQAATNYRAWLDLTGLIALCGEADVFVDAVIDWAVHSGHPRAIRSMQAAVQVRPDGVIGPVTRAAIDALGTAGRRAAAAKVVADRVRHSGGLITADPAQYSRNAKGWANRQAEFIEALA